MITKQMLIDVGVNQKTIDLLDANPSAFCQILDIDSSYPKPVYQIEACGNCAHHGFLNDDDEVVCGCRGIVGLYEYCDRWRPKK